MGLMCWTSIGARQQLCRSHPQGIAIRLFFIAVIVWLYLSTLGPLFLIVLAVVALGVLLTVAAFFLDQR